MSDEASEVDVKAPSKRASQRPTLSCTECARRKIKCDKRIPCEPCKKRGRERTCVQEEWVQPGSDRDIDIASRTIQANVHAEIASLRQQVMDLEALKPRLARLESLLSSHTSASGSPIPRSSNPADTVSPSASSISDRLRTGANNAMDGNEDPSVQFEHLALGHVGGHASGSRQTAPLSPTPSDAISPTSSGPIFKAQSDSIIEFALSIAYMHPVVHFTTFRNECRAFWAALAHDRNPLLNQAWLALYLALLSVGVHHMSLRQAAACGLSADDAQSLPRLWFSDCIAALERSKFMSDHTLQAVQTIAVLGFSGYDIAPANQLSVLHSCAVRIAQNLKLHRLGADPTYEIPPQMRMEREIGKRVWWALVVSDWNWIPQFRSWSISPEHFTTPIPSNWRDDEFPQLNFAGRPMSDDGISMVMQQIIVGQAAAVMQRFFARLLGDQFSDHEDTIAEAEAEIQRLVAGFPPALQQNPPPHIASEGSLPAYVPALRHYLQMTTSHKRLVMHRHFLQFSASRRNTLLNGGGGGSADMGGAGAGTSRIRPQVRESRAICVSAARHIIGELAQIVAREVRPTWSTPYQAAGAATLLMLDVLERQATGCLDEETAARRRDLELGIRALEKLAGWSAIAARGVQLVQSLLNENLAFSGPTASGSQKREYEGSSHDSPRSKRPLYDPSRSSFADSNSDASSVLHRRPSPLLSPRTAALSAGTFSFPAPQPFDNGGHDLLDFTASFNFAPTASVSTYQQQPSRPDRRQQQQTKDRQPTPTRINGVVDDTARLPDDNIESLLNQTFGLYDFGSVFPAGPG